MTMQVTTGNHGTLNLRAQPTTSSSIIATIPYGAQVEAEKLNDTWSTVTYKNKSGYAMSKFLSDVSSASTITKADLQRVYDSLKSTLSIIESILK